MPRKAYTSPPLRSLKTLQPAPLPVRRPQTSTLLPPRGRNFLDLPAELRVEIYRLALQNVIVHIIPCDYSTSETRENNAKSVPHPLLRTSRQIRDEVLPLMHTTCPIWATVTDFDFSGLLTWLQRIPPHELRGLAKNQRLAITLCTTKRARGDLPTLRRWLHDRADSCRPQPDWNYNGLLPQDKIASDLRRRAKRMSEPKKAAEFRKMLAKIGVHVPISGAHEEEERDDTPM